MRNARLLILIAALVVPLFWTGTVWAAEEPAEDQLNDAEIELNDNVSYWNQGMAPAPDTGTKLENAVVTGTVVGANCWLARGLEGDKYRDSAIACARNGTPLVILTDDGSLVYPITIGTGGTARPDNEKLMSYAEQHVTVTGMLIRRGMERGIVIDSIASTPAPKNARTFASKQVANTRLAGRVVDVSCWIKGGNAVTADPKCVGNCAAAGDPLVIVTRSGRIYYPVSTTMPSRPVGTSMLSDYCAKPVQVYGTAIARGNGRAIIISKVVPVASKK